MFNFIQKAMAQDRFQELNPLKYSTVTDLLDGIARFLLILASPIVAIMVIWGAFQILTSGGNPDKAKTGRNTILWALVGLIIVLSAKSITAIIKRILGA